MVSKLSLIRSEPDRSSGNQDGYGSSDHALWITKGCLKAVSEYIAEDIKKQPPQCQFTDAKKVIGQLQPDLIALCALNSVLHGVATETEFSVLCVNVGINIAAECWAAGLTKHDPKLAVQIERVARKRVYAVKMRRKAAVQIASRAGYTLDEWSRDRHAHAGNWLVNCVVEACPGMFELVETGKKQYLALSEDMRERAERAIEEVIARTLCRSRRRSLRFSMTHEDHRACFKPLGLPRPLSTGKKRHNCKKFP